MKRTTGGQRSDADAARSGRGRRLPPAWRFVLLRYLPFVALANLGWEIAQLPLYAIWTEDSVGAIAFAVLHCTVGDVLIALAALFPALMLTRRPAVSPWHGRTLVVLTLAFGLIYTAVSEHLNTAVWGNWAYSRWMPIVPVIDVGAAPMLQWLLIPLGAFLWARRKGA